MYNELVKNWVPEVASDSTWSTVTFNQLLDMATGHYTSDGYEVDEGGTTMTSFFALSNSTRSAKMSAATSFPSKTTPGTKWVYHSSDSFILSAAMNAYLKSKAGSTADIWDMTYTEVLQPIGELSDRLAAVADEAGTHLAGVRVADGVLDSHPPGDLAPRAAHVDVLSPVTQLRCTLDDGRLPPVVVEPVRQGGAGDAGARDENASFRRGGSSFCIRHHSSAPASWVRRRCRMARNSGNVKANAVSAAPTTYSHANRMPRRRASTMRKTLPATATTSRSTLIDDTAGPLVNRSPRKFRIWMTASTLKHQVPIRPTIASAR